MSRTRVENLVGDFEDEFIIGGSGAFIPEKLYSERLIKISAIEVVPRKMVEMIIEKCKEVRYIWNGSDEVKEYAESLLKQFEEEVSE